VTASAQTADDGQDAAIDFAADAWARGGCVDPPAELGLPDAAARNRWRYTEGALRAARDLLDPLGDEPPVDSSSLRDISARAFIICAARYGFDAPTSAEAIAIADNVVAEAVRQAERDAIRRKESVNGQQQHAAGGGDIDLSALRPLSAYAVSEPSYLWRPYIQLGAVNLLVGDYDMGKTWVACAIAAAQTKGWQFPDPRTGKPADGVVEPSNVLYFTAENDPATIRFRIDRLGGDPDRVFIWDTSVKPLPKLSEIDQLDAAFVKAAARSAIFDPIQSGLDHRRNMDKANEVRPLLDALAGLARKHTCAILGLGHLNKATSLQAKHRIIGSIDFGAAPRSILVAAPLRSAGPDHRVLVHLKSSVSKRGRSLGYVLEGEDQNVEFTWTGAVDVDLDELLAPPRSERTDSKKDQAAEFLREFLADGEKTREAISEAAEARGISEGAIKRASIELKVKVGSFGFPRKTTWSLPAWVHQ
jgi:hypothetical protein